MSEKDLPNILRERLTLLRQEISEIEKEIGPEDCGHLITAVQVLRERAEKLSERLLVLDRDSLEREAEAAEEKRSRGKI